MYSCLKKPLHEKLEKADNPLVGHKDRSKKVVTWNDHVFGPVEKLLKKYDSKFAPP